MRAAATLCWRARYRTRLPATRAAAHLTALVVAHRAGVSVPLEAAFILRQALSGKSGARQEEPTPVFRSHARRNAYRRCLLNELV